MNRHALCLGLALPLFAAIPLAGATSLGAAIEDSQINHLDKNKDGMVSKAEASSDQQLMAHFDKSDANHDGQLDSVELDVQGAPDKAPGGAAQPVPR